MTSAFLEVSCVEAAIAGKHFGRTLVELSVRFIEYVIRSIGFVEADALAIPTVSGLQKPTERKGSLEDCSDSNVRFQVCDFGRSQVCGLQNLFLVQLVFEPASTS